MAVCLDYAFKNSLQKFTVVVLSWLHELQSPSEPVSPVRGIRHLAVRHSWRLNLGCTSYLALQHFGQDSATS